MISLRLEEDCTNNRYCKLTCLTSVKTFKKQNGDIKVGFVYLLCLHLLIQAINVLFFLSKTLTIFIQETCDVFTLPKIPTTWSAYFDMTVTLVFLAWVLFHAIIAVLPIGTVATGLPLRDGTKLNYRCNGKHTDLLCLEESALHSADKKQIRKPSVYPNC